MSRTSSSLTSRSANPFKIEDECSLFGFKEANSIRMKQERDMIRSMTLKERQELLRPVCTPSISSQKTRRAYATTSMSNRSTNNRTRRTLRMSDFIQNKRQVFLMQLVQDTKINEIDKINKQIKQNEDSILEQEEELQKLSQQYKMISTQSEQQVANGKKRAEEANCLKIELQSKLRKKVHDIGILKSEISKNTETLEQYQEYYNFLDRIKPDGETVDYYFKDIKLLEQEFDNVEADNLFIIRQCIAVSDQINSGKSTCEEKLKAIEEALNNVAPLLQKNNAENEETSQINYDYSKELRQQLDATSKEVESITAEVLKTYINCYGEDPKLNVMVMLNKLNNDMEDMYLRAESVSKAFIHQKQTILDKDRRERQRIAAQAAKEALANQKKEQALERAKMPIKKKFGRPVIARSTIRKAKRTDDEKLRRLAREQKAQEELLFGNSY